MKLLLRLIPAGRDQSGLLNDPNSSVVTIPPYSANQPSLLITNLDAGGSVVVELE